MRVNSVAKYTMCNNDTMEVCLKSAPADKIQSSEINTIFVILHIYLPLAGFSPNYSI